MQRRGLLVSLVVVKETLVKRLTLIAHKSYTDLSQTLFEVNARRGHSIIPVLFCDMMCGI